MSTSLNSQSSSIHSSRSAFMPSPIGASRPSRPAQMDPAMLAQIEGGTDPQIVNEISHTSAAVLLNRVHKTQSPEIVERVLNLVENEGIEVIADLWSQAQPDSLPGMLFRLYLLRESLRKQREAYAEYWNLGEPSATSASAITGIDESPTGDDIARLADSILSGAFTGDFAVALYRASAFTAIISCGMRSYAKKLTQKMNDSKRDDSQRLASVLHKSANMHALSLCFANGAKLWRLGKLD